VLAAFSRVLCGAFASARWQQKQGKLRADSPSFGLDRILADQVEFLLQRPMPKVARRAVRNL